ncbi:transcriptional regulator, LysR family [Collimonas sp. OK607]|uniref:LysR family transcriptional regulator n=1 Tax=Collimonas sp. OK607 TaxID=1798194 RepID=UPI0008E32216|nr:LysR family transcriptional regulator [Collimonas sp. OK607]SFB16892.1 transcriptional regulator, LysR family [Collimonas sp. OK607]
MADWENLRHFAALAQAGTLSGAARQLHVEHATIARRIAALEAELNLKLVDRRGRRLSLTMDGERIAALVEHMERDAQAINRAADGARLEVAGHVTISAPPALAAAMLARPLVALRKQHPDLDISILGETRQVSLERREADIAIRLNRPTDGDFIIVKLTELTYHLYANRAYLDQTPPEDWAYIGYIESMDAASQQAALIRHMAGESLSFRTTTLDIQIALASEGGGVAMLPTFMMEDDSTLVPAIPDQQPVMRDAWLVWHADLKSSAAIRAVVKSIQDAFGKP